MDDPIAVDAWRWWRWWKRGQLQVLFDPYEVPNIVTEAIDVLDAGLEVAREAVSRRTKP